MTCGKCGNEHPGHKCDKYVDHLKMSDAEIAFKCGVPLEATICEAIWWPCDKTCVWADPCKGHIECQCVDKNGNEFLRVLTMDNAQYLMWKTKMRIHKVLWGDGEIGMAKRREHKEGAPPVFKGCPECGGQVFPSGGRCFSCPSCGWSACS